MRKVTTLLALAGLSFGIAVAACSADYGAESAAAGTTGTSKGGAVSSGGSTSKGGAASVTSGGKVSSAGSTGVTSNPSSNSGCSIAPANDSSPALLALALGFAAALVGRRRGSRS